MLLLGAIALGGCSERKLVLNPGVNVSPVVFESDEARAAFVDEVNERHADGYAKLPPGELSTHAFFNQQVQLADRDGDGIISDAEAWRYVHPE
jgi:hypothetical protein